MAFPGTTSFALQSDVTERRDSTIGHRFADFFNGGGQHAKFKRGMTFPHHSALELKKRVERVLARPDEEHDKYLHKEGWAQAIAKSSLFEAVTMIVIAANAVWMAVDTDHNDADTVIESDFIFQLTEHFFCLYFSFELTVRFCAYKATKFCCADKWFIFDSCMLLLMITEVWVFTVVILIERASDPSSKSVNGGAFGNASILKVARLIRLTRIARMAKLLRAMPEVMVILRAMYTATRTVVITLLILGMIVYVFAIGFCNITKDTSLGRMYFPDVRTSMLTLLVSGAFPDVWDIVHDVADTHWLLWMVLIIFLLLSTVTVMNMMIGVLVEVVNGASRTERETVEAELIRESFMKALRAKGYTEQPAEITLHKQHFLEILEVPIVRRTLASTGVDLAALVDLVDFLFRHKPTQRLLKLMETCLQLRSANTATVKDLIDIRRFITSELEWMAHRILVQMEEHDKGHQPALSSTVDSIVFKQTCF